MFEYKALFPLFCLTITNITEPLDIETCLCTMYILCQKAVDFAPIMAHTFHATEQGKNRQAIQGKRKGRSCIVPELDNSKSFNFSSNNIRLRLLAFQTHCTRVYTFYAGVSCPFLTWRTLTLICKTSANLKFSPSHNNKNLPTIHILYITMVYRFAK